MARVSIRTRVKRVTWTLLGARRGTDRFDPHPREAGDKPQETDPCHYEVSIRTRVKRVT